jgi:2,3-diketo-5-methylthiopentyl-1-phosphate enolase
MVPAAAVYGECASAAELKLLDLVLPASFVEAFSGPRFGTSGIRERLGVEGRPLLITMIKHALGLTPAESGQVFLEAALGGVDMIKDDELLVSHPWSDLVDRVREHGQAARRAFEQTGQRTLYFVNVTDRPDRLW